MVRAWFVMGALQLCLVAVSGPAAGQQLDLPSEPGLLSDAPPSPPMSAAKGVPTSAAPYDVTPQPLAIEASPAPSIPVEQPPGGWLQPSVEESSGSPEGPSAFSVDPARGFHLRASYATESYGQPAGSLSLGTMRLFPTQEDRMFFLDGQAVLNEESHVGYNLGVGFRQLTLPVFPFSPDDAKLLGLSIWSDGSTTRHGNFISQLGASAEWLGDTVDLRGNAYVPLQDQPIESDFVNTGDLDFIGNTLSQLSQGVRESPLNVGEGEIARRIRQRDFWLVAGGYGLWGHGNETAGFKLGARGYVTPDLLCQFAVTDDDLFDTNAVFTATWFIGRTRSNWHPTQTVLDRMREPVLRNNYVSVVESAVAGSTAMTDAATGETLRFVHADSTAAPGGDGTAENPLNNLNNLQANSEDGDRVLLAADSSFVGQTATLRDNQQLLGESSTSNFTVNTAQRGVVTLPRISTGTAAPTLSGPAGGSAVVLADTNTINNLTIDGGGTGINGLAGAGNATLQNLNIRNQTVRGIVLTPLVRDAGTTTETVAFTTNISGVTFADNAADIVIDAADTAATTATRNKNVTITGVTTTGVTGESILVENTTAGSTLTINNLTYNGGTTGDAAVHLRNNAGSTTLGGTSTLTGGQATGRGVFIEGGTGAVTVANTFDITGDVGATAVDISGANGAITYSGDIINHTGVAYAVTNQTGTNVITLAGNATGLNGNGAVITNASDVVVTADFNGTVDDAILATYNTTGTKQLRADGVTSSGGITVTSAVGSGPLDVGIRGSTLQDGISISAQHNGLLDLQMASNSVTAAGTADALAINVGPQVDADILLSAGNYTAANAAALRFNTSSTAAGGVRFQTTGATYSNNSGTSAAIINASGVDAAPLNFTAANNTFGNSGAGLEFEATSLGTSNFFASLENNNAGTGQFSLTETVGSTFRVSSLFGIGTRNTGTINFTPGQGDFTDTSTVTPTVPTVPSF